MLRIIPTFFMKQDFLCVPQVEKYLYKLFGDLGNIILLCTK